MSQITTLPVNESFFNSSEENEMLDLIFKTSEEKKSEPTMSPPVFEISPEYKEKMKPIEKKDTKTVLEVKDVKKDVKKSDKTQQKLLQNKQILSKKWAMFSKSNLFLIIKSNIKIILLLTVFVGLFFSSKMNELLIKLPFLSNLSPSILHIFKSLVFFVILIICFVFVNKKSK